MPCCGLVASFGTGLERLGSFFQYRVVWHASLLWFGLPTSALVSDSVRTAAVAVVAGRRVAGVGRSAVGRERSLRAQGGSGKG